ncbi:MAG: hypothetical protein R3B36_08960 [Polyangiaceae bacterium]
MIGRWAMWGSAVVGAFALAGCSISIGEGDGDDASLGQAVVSRSAPEGLFDRALCVCGKLEAAGSLVTEAEDGQAADVGIEGHMSSASGTRIAGSLFARGEVSNAGSIRVRDDLVCGGDLDTAGSVDVGRDLSVGGDLDTVGSLDVGGTLRVRGDSGHVGGSHVGGRASWGAPTAPACGCRAFDVAAAVAIARDDNDDARRGVDPELRSVGRSDITLRGGRYYFSNASAVGTSRWHIEGNVRVFVDGDLESVGRSSFDLAEGATLDLFVAGRVHAVGSLVAGNAKDPSAFRLYVGGAGSVIGGAGELDFRAFVYAPRASLEVAGSTRVVGALVARHVSYAGDLRVRFAKASPRPAEPPPANESPRAPADPSVPPADAPPPADHAPAEPPADAPPAAPPADAPPADVPPVELPPCDPPSEPADAGAPSDPGT